MNLKHLTDQQLVLDLKTYVCEERSLLTKVLYHLKEFEVRKLYSSLGHSSLYDYACKELKYSQDQAYRRISAMRLLKEIPEISKQIDSGRLSLSNISQAQRFFNEFKVNKAELNKTQKLTVLKKLEDKSVREAQKEILKLSPIKFLPQESKKQIAPTKVHVNFIMEEALEQKLDEVKSLLGPKAINLTLAELINQMADLSLLKLKEKRFGKKRVTHQLEGSKVSAINKESTVNMISEVGAVSNNRPNKETSNLDVKTKKQAAGGGHRCDNTQLNKTKITVELPVKPNRYISKALKYKVWLRDRGKCSKCQTRHNLNFDHIKPMAFGGMSTETNLRLLCFHCNQRYRLEAGL